MLIRAGYLIELRLTCSFINENNSDIWRVSRCRCDTCIIINICSNGNISIIICCFTTSLFSKETVEESILIFTVPVKFLCYIISVINNINPFRNIFRLIIFRLTCWSIHYNRTIDFHTWKPSYCWRFSSGYIIRISFFINFKIYIIEHLCRIFTSESSHKIIMEILWRTIMNRLFKLYIFGSIIYRIICPWCCIIISLCYNYLYIKTCCISYELSLVIELTNRSIYISKSCNHVTIAIKIVSSSSVTYPSFLSSAIFIEVMPWISCSILVSGILPSFYWITVLIISIHLTSYWVYSPRYIDSWCLWSRSTCAAGTTAAATAAATTAAARIFQPLCSEYQIFKQSYLWISSVISTASIFPTCEYIIASLKLTWSYSIQWTSFYSHSIHLAFSATTSICIDL